MAALPVTVLQGLETATADRRGSSVHRRGVLPCLGPLEGRVAVVSGANHGIGAAAAPGLARLGADVVVNHLACSPDDDDPGRPPSYRVHGNRSVPCMRDVCRCQHTGTIRGDGPARPIR